MSWAFLFLDLIIPIILIAFGLSAKRIAEGPINSLIGYRTARSTASREAWEFANLAAGKLLLREGAVQLCLSLIFGVLAFFLCRVEVQGTISTVLTLVQSLSIALSIPYIEKQLEKRFQ